MENMEIQISRIRNYSDTNPVTIRTTWAEFVESCRHPAVKGRLPLDRYLVADKATRDREKDGPAIIAGSYAVTNTRKQEDMAALSMIVLDLDDGFYTFDQLCEKLECFECVVFTSYSHSERVPKFRAYLPLLGGITGSLKATLGRIIDYFDETVGHIDPACRKPGQLFYAPAHPPGAERLFQCRHISGVLLDPADFPEEVAPALRPRSQAPTGPECTATGTKPGDLFNASANWADILEPLGWRHSHRNHWTRPGKPFGVSASVLDAGLYVHSSAPETEPFKCGISYTPFGAYALIHHGGDYSAAARELRRLSQMAV